MKNQNIKKNKMKLQCPKCKTVIETEKMLEFCICGGKYEKQLNLPAFEDMLNMMGLGKEKKVNLLTEREEK